jgi:hypothetical protein
MVTLFCLIERLGQDELGKGHPGCCCSAFERLDEEPRQCWSSSGNLGQPDFLIDDTQV